MIRFGVVAPEEELVYSHESCQLKINNGELQRGSLLMTQRFVALLFMESPIQLSDFSEICWKKQDSDSGFMIPWDKITVQAITQEPQRCIYFMIDAKWPEPEAPANGNGNHNEDAAEDEDEGHESDASLEEITEFHVIPALQSDVDDIYYVMSKVIAFV